MQRCSPGGLSPAPPIAPQTHPEATGSASCCPNPHLFAVLPLLTPDLAVFLLTCPFFLPFPKLAVSGGLFAEDSCSPARVLCFDLRSLPHPSNTHINLWGHPLKMRRVICIFKMSKIKGPMSCWSPKTTLPRNLDTGRLISMYSK